MPRREVDWEWEFQILLNEALADAEEQRIYNCIQTGDCCCPQEEPSLYSPGGPTSYMDECPVHGEDADNDE